MKNNIILLAIIAFLFSSCIDYNKDSGFENEDPIGNMTENDIRMWITTQSKIYMMKELPIEFSDKISTAVLRIDPSITYQTIDGFGGTLSGSSAYLFMKMSAEERTAALKELFDPKEGIGLESIRLSIGASDFSMDLYTYCDEEGIENFAIPEIDKRDLLPVLKEIIAINPNVKFMASPWSPPAWMKTSKNLNSGTLRTAVYDDFATYFVKYIEAMKAEGITIDAITLQNEAQFVSYVHPSMRMSWSQQATIIGKHLGPKLKEAGLSTKILVLDHNFELFDYPIKVLSDTEAYPYIHGTAFHGYAGTPADIKNVTEQFPEKAIYQTELSGGGWNEEDNMKTLFYYMKDMLVPTIQNGSSNFMMFNIALDPMHGPTTPGGTFCEDCRGIVTIDLEGKTVTKELEYYLLGHYGKVIRTGAKRIQASHIGTMPDGLTSLAFLNPDGTKALVLVNDSGADTEVTVKDQQLNKRFVYKVPNSSIVSFLINN